MGSYDFSGIHLDELKKLAGEYVGFDGKRDSYLRDKWLCRGLIRSGGEFGYEFTKEGTEVSHLAGVALKRICAQSESHRKALEADYAAVIHEAQRIKEVEGRTKQQQDLERRARYFLKTGVVPQ